MDINFYEYHILLSPSISFLNHLVYLGSQICPDKHVANVKTDSEYK